VLSGTISATLAGAGGLTKTSQDTVVLAGANTYTGGTTLNAGALQINGSGTLGDPGGSTNINGGILNLGLTTETQATWQLAAGMLTYGTAIGTTSFTMSIPQSGSAGTLSANVTTPNFVMVGGTVDAGSTVTASLSFNMQQGTVNGVLAGTGALTKSTNATVTLRGLDTYSGDTTILAGTLQAAAVNTLSPNSAYTVAAGATLDLYNNSQSIGSLAGAGSVTLGLGTLAIGNDGTSTTYSGIVSGTGGLTKIGGGTLLLTNTNSYSGPTSVNSGTLSVTGDISSSSGVTVDT